MNKKTKIKSYEIVAKAFSDILRRSYNHNFRSQFYNLLDVTNTNDAQTILNRKLKQFLKVTQNGSLLNKTQRAVRTFHSNIQSTEETTLDEIGEYCCRKNDTNFDTEQNRVKESEKEETTLQDSDDDEFGFFSNNKWMGNEIYNNKNFDSSEDDEMGLKDLEVW
uniref:Uncharacterized protein n=1 Tax=Clastoptera arizonana TaxID=38151 RepID=A0A1B6E3R9_9HEMI